MRGLAREGGRPTGRGALGEGQQQRQRRCARWKKALAGGAHLSAAARERKALARRAGARGTLLGQGARLGRREGEEKEERAVS